MSKEFTVEQMQALMRSVAEHNIGELSFECDGFKLKIKGKAPTEPMQVASAPIAVMAAAAAVQSESQPCAEVQTVEAAYITSPLVGTFYAASAPDKAPFVTVGQRVNKGDVVFIIESMKVMNEVLAECDGIVAEILVENGEPVEFGQNVLRIE